MAVNADLERQRRQLGMSRLTAVVVGVGGVLALFGVYWDDSWHTDIGRDSALAPPHQVLYGGVALVGLATAVWALRVLIRTRSLKAMIRYRPLVFAGLGAVAVLGAAPLDAFWHSAYGRDAVLWSPPHIATVFAATVMVQGLLGGIHDQRWPLLDEILSGLLLANLAVAVMEYETDVPQFSDAFYLPVAVLAGLLAAWFARCITGHRYAVTIMVVGYVVLRLAITGILMLLGRSAPDLPIAYLGLLAMDLPIWRNAVQRYAAAAAGMSALALAAAAVGLASESPAALLTPTLLAMVVLAAATIAGRRRTAAAAALLAVAATTAATLWQARPAAAHDPGQGTKVAEAELSARSDGTGNITLTLRAAEACTALEPVQLVARRDGMTRTAALVRVDACRFTSSIHVPNIGRWFIYAQVRAAGVDVEGWLPVLADQRQTLVERRWLYRPSGAPGVSAPEAVTGVAVYVVGLALLGSAVWLARCRHESSRS